MDCNNENPLKKSNEINHNKSNDNESKSLNKNDNLSEPTIFNELKLNNCTDSLEKNNKEKIEYSNDLNDYYSSLEYEEKNNPAYQNHLLTINDLIGPDINKELTLDIMNENFNNFESGKVSKKSYGYINAYAANTNPGIARDYNEDRVSIVININKPVNYSKNIPWPKASFFAVFDGHGGNGCADFLRDNLLKLICNNNFFPKDIEKAINYGFEEVDKLFLETTLKDGKIIDNSGSCALILLIIENKLYIANVGDSRSIISMKNGLIRKDVTRDHKPNYPYEKERIISNGGKIYQTKSPLNLNENEDETHCTEEENNNEDNLLLLGPFRVQPGGLSVSRTIGDPLAKLVKFKGNPKVIISKPDIYCYDLEKDDVDFVILGCDGIYDHLSSKDVFNCAWMMINSSRKNNKNIEDKIKNIRNEKINDNEEKKIDIFSTCGNIVDFILKASMSRKSFDNVTCVIVFFKDLLSNNTSTKKDKISSNFLNKRNEINIVSLLTEESSKKNSNSNSKIINNDNNKIIESNQLFGIQKNENNEEKIKKNINIPKKKILGDKIQIKSINKKDKNLFINNENKLNNNIKLGNIQRKNINKKNVHSGENSQRISNNNLFKEIFKNNETIKKINFSSKKTKNENNNLNIIDNNKFRVNSNERKLYNLLNYNNKSKNISKKTTSLNNTKKIFSKNRIKPLFINNNNNYADKNNNKNKLIYNLQLNLKINNNNINLKKNHNEEASLTNTLSYEKEFNSYTNKKEKDSIESSNNDSPKISNINTINSRTRDKFKIHLNYATPYRNGKNNNDLKLKPMNKKSISYYTNNNLMNNLRIIKDKNVSKNKLSKISELDMINFNSINRMNFNSSNENGNINGKLRILSGEKHKLKIGQNNINSNNYKQSIMNNILFNKKSQRVNINKEKKLLNNIKDDLYSEKDKFKMPNINIKK